MKNITLSADEHLIEAAYQRAAEEHTTLNEQFQLWLKHYVQHEQQAGPSEAQGTLADFLQGHIGVLQSSEYMLDGAHIATLNDLRDMRFVLLGEHATIAICVICESFHK